MRKELVCQYVTTGRRWREAESQTPSATGYDSVRSETSEPVGPEPASLTPNHDLPKTAEPQSLPERVADHQQAGRTPGTVRFNEPARLDSDQLGGMATLSNRELQSPVVPSHAKLSRVPSGQELLPYIDSLLENVHPISCNNFLHPGYLCESLDQAPQLLLLAICASSSKFMSGLNSAGDGLRWAAEAKSLIMDNFNRVSTLTITAIQFLVLHEMHGGEYTSAWNLVGMS